MTSKRLCMTRATGLALTLAMASLAGATVHPPDINPANFVRYVTNPFFPLQPGTRFFYQGQKDGVPTSNVTEVMCDTKVILGVTTTVVHDQAFDQDGRLAEDTFDWYAQDRDGNVWYFGEDTKELDPNGNVISTEGSWEAGVNDADPGTIMLANPQVGDRYYQEFAPGVAEDQARVESRDASACIAYPAPNSCFDQLLLTKETTRLDPGVVEIKYYRATVGFILGVNVKGGNERTELVDITFSKCKK